jgi:hypothetical protein
MIIKKGMMVQAEGLLCFLYIKELNMEEWV